MKKGGAMWRGSKDFARDLLAQVLLSMRLSHPATACAGKLLILTFHRVLPESLRKEYPLPGLVVTPDELRWVLSELAPHFELHTVSDAARRLSEPDRPRPLLAISFDDGQWDNLNFAAPVLNDLGLRATFYIPTDFIGTSRLLWHDDAGFAWQACRRGGVDGSVVARLVRHLNLAPDASIAAFLEALKTVQPEMRQQTVSELHALSKIAMPDWARLMTWQEVASLVAIGHEIGSHGCSHALFPQLDLVKHQREIEQSMQVITQKLGVPVKSLCYPNGSYDQDSTKLARQLGYENAVTTQWGVNLPDRPCYELLRCDMDAQRLVDRRGVLSRARLAMRLAGFQPGLAT